MLVKVQHRRALGARPRTACYITAMVILLYWFLLRDQRYRTVRFSEIVDLTEPPQPQPQAGDHNGDHGQSPDITESTAHVIPDNPRENAELAQQPLSDHEAGAIYGNTLETLVEKQGPKAPENEDALASIDEDVPFNYHRAYTFSPYPDYNSTAWKSTHAEYVPCIGPTGAEVEDISVFRGRPKDFPEPGFGSYDLLRIDGDVCFERETRLGQYGVATVTDEDGREINWDTVNWGILQHMCRERNKARFESDGPPNEFIAAYDNLSEERLKEEETAAPTTQRLKRALSRRWSGWWDSYTEGDSTTPGPAENMTTVKKEPRTALLLRSYTGKKYTENDKLVIRSLVTELSLRTGGEYQVFLLIHVKEDADIWGDDEEYRRIIEAEVPQEFWDMTFLWSENAVRRAYPKLDWWASLVHDGQYLSVQMFMQEHREFDYVWNWELDSRVIGNHYDVLTKLADFSRKQPRKGLWERNERFYIPGFYGDYDTHFRKYVEGISGADTVWGAPNLPIINPIGPKPPVATPEEDNYEWGAGEEADLITLSPIFNPINSDWAMRDHIWGYRSDDFPVENLPLRTTIITQSRISRRLIDTMHAENLRGNQVASEMATQTVALVHGLKAVYAPMPVFFDRPWNGTQLARWFNGGPRGTSGGHGSAMGWGREGRFQGATWYYRANPPQRIYNNWLGYEDTGIGGPQWEEEHGRPCLPAMILHPVKDVEPTEPGHSTESKLPY
ncbi:hypothetical protein QBC46DRAFT_424945, partial [Diplogelasinospora grovesii]